MNKTTDFIRQPGSNALISNDNKSYGAFIKQRDRNNKIDALERDVNELRCNIMEIKALLLKLVDGK